jgi:DNA replication protein DnaC
MGTTPGTCNSDGSTIGKCAICGTIRYTQAIGDDAGHIKYLRHGVCKCNASDPDWGWLKAGMSQVELQRAARWAAEISEWSDPPVSFETWRERPDEPDTTRAYLGLKQYAGVFPPQTGEGAGFYIFGNNGGGKSHLLESTARAIKERGFIVVYLTQEGFAKLLQRCMDDDGPNEFEIWNAIKLAHFVAVDGLADQPLNEWRRREFGRLVDLRGEKPLAVSSNTDPDSLRPLITPAGLAPASYDRVGKLCFCYPIEVNVSRSYRDIQSEEMARRRMFGT